MEILLSFCLRCLSRTASMTLRVSGSCSEPSLLRISAKNREKWLLSSLALYFKMSSLRPLVVAHIFQTLFQVLLVLIVLFFLPCLFSASCCISCPEISGNLAATFLKTKNKQTTKMRAYAVVMVTSLYHLFFCYTSITQKYHHYQRIKSLKFLGLYYNLLNSNQMTPSFCP